MVHTRLDQTTRLRIPSTVLATLLWLAFPASAARAQAVLAPVGIGLEAYPGPGGELAAGTGALLLRLSPVAALPSAGLRVWLDGQEYTDRLIGSGTERQLEPQQRLAIGAHRLRVAWRGVGGADVARDWTFTVFEKSFEAPVRIVKFTGGGRTLYEGDRCELEVQAPRKSRVEGSFGSRPAFALLEVEPGIYRASYEVSTTDRAVTAPLQVRCTAPDGTLTRTSSTQPVRLCGQFYTIRIDSPDNGARVGWDFTIKGHTRPFALVSISPQIGGSAQYNTITGTNPGRIGRVIQNLGTLEVQADEHGRFEQAFGFPIHMFAVRYTFSLTARTTDGEDAVPRTFSVIMGAPERETKQTPAEEPPASEGRERIQP